LLLPLPAQASGLCVFSQDFRVIRKLTEDAAFVEQELVADVKGTIAPDGLARLGHGLARGGRPLPPAKVSWQSETRLRFAVKGIDPDWIAWMCAQVGLELVALRRIRIGRIPMAGLPPGEWRYLPAGERF
jgi:23S rRNA pseudouridine2604 synthase